MRFSPVELERYSRQLLLPEIGLEGQDKIRSSRVLCIGAGGLGAPAAIYLVAAGIGQLGMVDADRVERSNLQRQILFGEEDIGRPKVEAAKTSLARVNPATQVATYPVRLNPDNALEIIEAYDVIIDCSDNLPTRYLTNDACVRLRKPNIYGAVFRFEGQASVFAPHLGGPCYRCLFPEPPPPELVPNCAESGVLGVLPGLVGSLQATETLKFILGQGSLLLGRLLLYNALEMKFREIKVQRDPACSRCGDGPKSAALGEVAPVCCAVGGAAAVALGPDEVSVQDMQKALDQPDLNIRVIDVREPAEHQMAHIPGTTLIPLSALPQRLGELNREQTIYLHCKTGGRSRTALEMLKRNGFTRVKSVRGGILAWSKEVDGTTTQAT